MPPAEARVGDSRRDPRLLLAIAGLLLLARVGVTVWEHRHPPAPHDLVEWVPLERAEALSRASRRPLLYDFSAEWCGPCNAMRHDVFENRRWAQWLSRTFVPVQVVDRQQEDGHNSPRVDSLQRAFAVTGFPTLVIVSPATGEHASRSGYANADTLMHWLVDNVSMMRMHQFIPGATLKP